MFRQTRVFIAVLIAVAGVGCDSADDTTDLDRFVGSWKVTAMSDAEGDQWAEFSSMYTSVVMTLAGDGTSTIVVTPRQGAAASVSGTFTVVEESSILAIVSVAGNQAVPASYTYSFVSDDVVRLTADATTTVIANTMYRTTFVGQLVITAERQ